MVTIVPLDATLVWPLSYTMAFTMSTTLWITMPKQPNKIFQYSRSPKACALRAAVFARDNFACTAPGCKYRIVDPPADYDGRLGVGKLLLNHTVPVSGGGSKWDPDNLKTLCASCNASKGKLPESEWFPYVLRDKGLR